MATKLTRTTAAAIAKDLVEGGIEDRSADRATAAHYEVGISKVWAIRRLLVKKANGGTPQRGSVAMDVYGVGNARAFFLDGLVSAVDAIANGWEDETLGITKA